MSSSQTSGYALLKKQREQKLKRLNGLTVTDYFNAMEDIRNGKPINQNLKRYVLYSYN